MLTVADPVGGPKGHVKISHKEDGCRRQPWRFHVSRPLPYPAAGSATGWTTDHWSLISSLISVNWGGGGDVGLVSPRHANWLTLFKFPKKPIIFTIFSVIKLNLCQNCFFGSGIRVKRESVVRGSIHSGRKIHLCHRISALPNQRHLSATL